MLIFSRALTHDTTWFTCTQKATRKAALHRGQADRISLTHDLDLNVTLTFNPRRATACRGLKVRS